METRREQRPASSSKPPKHSVAPARIACACGKGIPRLWKNSVGFARSINFPFPVRKNCQAQYSRTTRSRNDCNTLVDGRNQLKYLATNPELIFIFWKIGKTSRATPSRQTRL